MINLNDCLERGLSLSQLVDIIDKLTADVVGLSYAVDDCLLISEKVQSLKKAADNVVVKNELICIEAGNEQELYSLHNVETGAIESSNLYCTYAAAVIGLSQEANYRDIANYEIKGFYE